MLTEHGCLSRRARLWARLPAGVDRVLCTAPSQLMYFAGFEAAPFVFNSQESQAALLLGRDGSAVLLADNVQGAFSRTAFATQRVEPLWYRCVESAPHRGSLLIQAVVEHLGGHPPAALGVELSHCPAGIVEGLRAAGRATRLYDVDGAVRELRRAKDSDEIASIRDSLRAAGAALAEVRRTLQPGQTGLDVYRQVLRVASETAGRPVQVYGDFVSGPECEAGGGPAGPRAVSAGDLVLLDFSVVLGGYRGDFCTTFVCAGTPTPRQREFHAACLAAMEAGRGALRPGATGRQIYESCREPLVRAGLADRFPHHAGHGVGLGHPEPPFLVPESDETLVSGDVVTLEPGLYLPGVGGMRFEHDFLITAEGYEQLSDHSLSLQQ